MFEMICNGQNLYSVDMDTVIVSVRSVRFEAAVECSARCSAKISILLLDRNI